MKTYSYAAALAGLVFLTAASIAQPLFFPPFYGTVPDRSVKHWIKYIVLGPRNSLPPIVWLSPEAFKTSNYPDETLIVLPRSRYDVVAKFTQDRLGHSDCIGTKRKFATWYTVEMSNHSNDRTQECVLLQSAACDYFFRVLRLSGANWARQERETIVRFMRSIRCKIE